MTGYILIATQLEEHDLVEVLGDEYRDYRRQVPGLLPLRRPPRRHPAQAAPQG
jgi:protein-S-isoprenylcysteine O-methyltransferase Ste14